MSGEDEDEDMIFQTAPDDSHSGPATQQEHSRVIIHIDIDCFYAQVEMVADPSLVSKPLGIQQKNIVVTCNYVARASGVGKCMLVTEALKVCPALVLVNGEDLAWPSTPRWSDRPAVRWRGWGWTRTGWT